MNIDLRFQDWSLVLQAASVRQYDDRAHRICVTGDLPEGWTWVLYASVFSQAFFNSIPLTETDGVLSAVLTRDDLAFGDTTYALQLVGEHGDARRHTNPVRLYVGASLSGDGVWPEVPRSFTDAEAAALDAAARAEQAAQSVQSALSDADLTELRETVNHTVFDLEHLDIYLADHMQDQTVHVSAAERAAWNASSGGAQTLERILTYTTDGTGGSGSVYLTTGDDGAPFALKLAVIRLSLLQSPTANGNFGVYLGSTNSFYVAKFTLSATTGMNANYSALLRAWQELGFWVSEQTPMSNNGYGQVYRNGPNLFAYGTEQYPAITSVRLVGTPSAPLRLELLGVRA